MGNPLTDVEAMRLLDDRLEKKFYGGYEEIAPVKDTFFDVKVDKKAWLEYYGLGDVPDPVAFEGLISYQGVAMGFHTKIRPKEFAGGLVFQRRLLDTDRYDEMDKKSKGLGKAAKRKMNKVAHEWVIYMDSSAFDYMIAEEGVALCSNSHTSKANVSTASGFDNLITLPFNPTNLEAARLISKKFKSDINERIETNFDTIVHPASLGEKVWEIQKSEGKVDEITNNENFHRGRWKAEELPLWDDCVNGPANTVEYQYAA